MKFGDKLISEMSDAELWAAIQSVAGMDNFRFDKLQDRRIQKQGHRLNKIFKANPPTENEAFTNIVNELNQEWKKRNVETL